MDITQATTPQARGECFHAHMRAVAAAMDGFVYAPNNEGESADWRASGQLISGRQKANLTVSLHLGDYYNKTPYRAECYGVYPQTDKRESYPSSEGRPTIGFMLTRSASQIAGDITRRMLPEYTKYFEKVANWVNRSNAAAAELEATRDAMKAAGFTFHGPSNEGQLLFARGEKLDYSRPLVYVYGGHVDLKLKNLTPEKAVALLEFLDLSPHPSYV